MRRNLSGLLFGVILVLAGLCYVGSLIFDYNFTIFFPGWWTLFIIVPSFVSILSGGPRAFNVASLLVGGLLLLSCLDVIPSMYFGEILVAGVILYIGIVLIVHFIRGPRKHINVNNGASYNINVNTAEGSTNYQANTQPNQDNGGKYMNTDMSDFPNYTAVLSGTASRCTSQNFQGARVSAILGGAEIDMRNVIITKDIEIFCTAILGGVDILAPQNVRISLKNTDILGGTGCTAFSQPADANVPMVTFITTAIMGGIDIK